MARRGVISGFITGAGFSISVAVVAALMVPLKQVPGAPPEVGNQTIAPPKAELGDTGADTGNLAKEDAPAMTTAEVKKPEAGEGDALPLSDIDTPEKPEVSEASAQNAGSDAGAQQEADVNLPEPEQESGGDLPKTLSLDSESGVLPQADTLATQEPPKQLPRLPSIGSDSGEDEQVPGAKKTMRPPALEQNAIPFEGDGKPMMSVIFLDIGDEGMARDNLMTFALPVTFAVPIDVPDAQEIAQTYGRNGFEVVAVEPQGGNATLTSADAGAVLEQYFDTVPNAIGLMDAPTATLQKDSRLVKAVLNKFAQTGHGLVTYAVGLNSVDRMADAQDVRSDTVFRVLDQNGEKAPTMKRYLDRAALEAGKLGHVIILGHSTPETVAAFANWAASPKARSVTFAPLSASLLE